MRRFKNLLIEQDGNSGLGYALIVGLGVLFMIFAIASVGSSVKNSLNQTGDGVRNALHGEVNEYDSKHRLMENSNYRSRQR